MQVPRYLRLNSHVETVTLHTFTDASGDAYGAVTYVRYQCKGGTVSTSLVASKTRVAPLSAQSIPRLELMGAVLGLRLALSIAKVPKINQSLLTFWSDRMNVLWWIRRPSRNFRPFIANRVGEIHRAWVHRFVNNWGTPPEGRSSGELSSQEISDTETGIIKEAQQEAFQEECKALVNFKSVPQSIKLLSLNPIIDADGLLRSDGRLRYANYLPFDARYPVILPRRVG